MTLRALALIAVVLAATGAAADRLSDEMIALQLTPLAGQTAPAFELPGLDGTKVPLAQFKGQVVLLYFWATW